MTKYKAKQTVNAVQWKQDNLEEIKQLLQNVIDGDEDGPFVYADYVEPYYLTSIGNSGGYYMLKTESDEFDPGIWIVVYENNEIEGMDDEQFNRMFEEVE